MIGNRIHLLELGHMNVAETTGLSFGLCNLSARSVDAIEHLVGLFILLVLGVSFGFHLSLDPRRLSADLIHQLLCFLAEVRFSSEGELER